MASKKKRFPLPPAETFVYPEAFDIRPNFKSRCGHCSDSNRDAIVRPWIWRLSSNDHFICHECAVRAGVLRE